MKNVLAMCIALWFTPAIAQALTIVVGAHNLQPNLAGQQVGIFLFSDVPDSTTGLSFNAQLGDGGPEVGGVDVTVSMTGDATGPGTLFENNHELQFDGGVPPSFVNVGFNVESGSVPIPIGYSLLAVLTFDTTGFDLFTWPLLVGGTVNGDTVLLGTEGELLITNGSIQCVPEPGSAVLAGLGFAGLVAWGWRKRNLCAILANRLTAGNW
jgi:hypothetical protein